MQELKAVKWSKDILPDYHRYYTFLKKVYRHEFRKNSFRRISIPIVERLDLIEKLYKKDKSFFSKKVIWDSVIRWDYNVWVMRSYINNSLEDEIQPLYFYYMWKYFWRVECDYKEENTIWAEIIWENDPILDALLIYLNYTVLNKIGIWDSFVLKINSIWVEKERIKYEEELRNFYENKKHLLSDKSKLALEENPIYLLSSKEEDEAILASQAPKMSKFLKKDSKEHFAKLKEYLNELWVNYEEDNSLSWNYFYCTNTIRQFINKNSWEIISRWWRYNWLSKAMWEVKEIPASWFNSNIDEIIKILKQKEIKIKNKDEIDLCFVQLWDEAKKLVLSLSLEAREEGINTIVSLWTPSMKQQMLNASRLWAKYVVMVWIMEARNWVFQVRNMEEWSQEEVKKEDLINYIKDKIWVDKLDFYCPAKDLII